MPQTDILIIGGGIIGASLAFELACRGHLSVTVLEANSAPAINGTASFASAGIVSPPSRIDIPQPMLELALRSLQLYPKLAAQLENEQAGPTGYAEMGELSLAANGMEVKKLQNRQRWHTKAGFEARWLSPEEVSEIEPLAGPNAGALYNPGAVVRAAWLTRALLEAARRKGVEVKVDHPVNELHMENNRVAGIALLDGQVLKAETVVLAAGAWSGHWLDRQIEAARGTAPGYARHLWPVRGQMLSVVAPEGTPTLKHVLNSPLGYALPRPGGDIAFGATVEPEAGFTVNNTPDGLRELGQLVHKLAPALDKAPIKETWAGLRPGTSGDRPMLGPIPELPSLWLAAGHYRSGILMAPSTAELLAGALLNDSAALARLNDFKPHAD
ncbi:MAG TPA: FAD-dependent oxidoreductase [Chloroflexia bacterium]|nr:FAD-dependent oxidoreductase [Chloroflexia bacterium]